MHEFDKAYWEGQWASQATHTGERLPANPYLVAETQHLPAGTALDAGCGIGTEALWLAERGWHVTGADISATALTTAARRAADAGLAERIDWLETDLGRWQPGRTWDLVVTNYAHPDTGQEEFYRRIASWVAPGGTLLIVAHRSGADDAHSHPDGATTTRAGITDLLAAPAWRIETDYDAALTVGVGGREVLLHDVVVRARRLR